MFNALALIVLGVVLFLILYFNLEKFIFDRIRAFVLFLLVIICTGSVSVGLLIIIIKISGLPTISEATF
jgi:hypothetical protein